MIPRCLLFAPAESERKIAKALEAGADAVILDLEDSVAEPRKDAARAQAAELLRAPRPAAPAVFVRINALETPHALADLAAVVPGADGIVLPKAEGAASVHRAARAIEALEARAGLPAGGIKILPVATETPAAVFALETFRRAAPHLAGLTWGAEDLSAAIGALSAREDAGGWTAPYLLVRALCLFAAAAAAVPAIETLFANYRDDAGLTATATRAARDGFSGMLAIHPAQIGPIQAAFTPSAAALAEAEAVVAAFAAAPEAGTVGLGGRMLDRPHLIQAQKILARRK